MHYNIKQLNTHALQKYVIFLRRKNIVSNINEKIEPQSRMNGFVTQKE